LLNKPNYAILKEEVAEVKRMLTSLMQKLNADSQNLKADD